ncbi:dihydrofolate reductase isoform X1 [Homalodisca vitripennis]|uniref:dihydrofolate reductase isoform X1 n=2 Tax=Homalodisca vitripennis TaxID=197043 RepID=UPI001EEC7F61|nr:dihydrofolate reductase isoform X1 [Homalodisca vitripennis]
MKIKLSLIVAASENLGIGVQGKIPWMLKKEMQHFTKMTSLSKDSGKHNAVIMGRKTWESIPEKFRPLKGRINIVLSRSEDNKYPPDVVMCNSFEEALEILDKPPLVENIENVWIIGGSSVYEEAMRHDQCHRIYITWIKKEFNCDTFFPKLPENFEETMDENVPLGIQEENGIQYEYKVYERKSVKSE